MRYPSSEDENHKTKRKGITMLKKAMSYPGNLLLNTAFLVSGEINPIHIKVLREVGAEIRIKIGLNF